MKDYCRAPVRGSECLNYDVGQSYAGKCLLIALQKGNMYAMECALCVCVCVYLYMLVKFTIPLEG